MIPSLNTIISKAALDAKLATPTAIVSGAGAGHEPFAHALVGKGGIAASVAGQVFASPSAGQVFNILKLVSKYSKEILVVVNNYTGDRLNFGLAVERLRIEEGVGCRLFCFGDDVSFDTEAVKKTGRRGLAGGTFLLKCLARLSEEGSSLEQLYDTAVRLTSRIATMSVSLSACDIPGSGTSFTLSDNEMEVGLGIHGESGVMRSPLFSSREVVCLLLDSIMDEKKSCIASMLKEGKPSIALLINNIGGLSQFDENIVTMDIIQECQSRELKVARVMIGTFVSSFSMNGVSVSVMIVDDEVLRLLDSPSHCPAFSRNTLRTVNSSPVFNVELVSREGPKSSCKPIPGLTPQLFRQLLMAASESLILVEEILNELDKQGGDGDCGLTCRKGAEAIKRFLSQTDQPLSFLEIAELCALEMGGTSGAIYSLLMTSIHDSVLKDNGRSTSPEQVLLFWSKALDKSLKTVTLYSWAEEGDRTMMDTLFHVLNLLKGLSLTSPFDLKEIWKMIVKSAEEGCKATASMKSNAGRSLYANQSLTQGKEDPGAVGVLTWIRAMAAFFQSLE